ncbi:Hypothetical predicted protein [Lecanosticta acicola]|uniref:Uncharacterized protein n=1 Tax=Lecanosticta acicola TaxID=111012 RepID=A0AAI8Z479_9PEZI|nr:Hypothetical predicted protein [Lecanosticta acicola]
MAADNSTGAKTSMPYSAIIMLCLLGAGAAVLCAWSMARHFFPEPGRDHGLNNVDAEGMTQAQYMRMVRLKNQEDLQRTYGHYNYVRPKPPAFAQSGCSVSSFS